MKREAEPAFARKLRRGKPRNTGLRKYASTRQALNTRKSGTDANFLDGCRIVLIGENTIILGTDPFMIDFDS